MLLVPSGVPVAALGAALLAGADDMMTATRRAALMEVVPLASADEVAALAADDDRGSGRTRPDAVLGVATGSTPLLTYRELIRRHQAGAGPSYDRVRCFTLDEYVGLPPGHPESYRATIARELTDPLGIPDERVHGPDPTEAQLATAGERYEASLAAAGGVDVQILGIGSDGHLAFNEPGSSLGSLTRIKTLTDQTRQDNARFFGSIDEVPRHVLTQGLGTILRARHLLLLATGAGQGRRGGGGGRGPALGLLPGVGPPAAPPRVGAGGRAAAAGLGRRQHYREVYDAKPAWQGL